MNLPKITSEATSTSQRIKSEQNSSSSLDKNSIIPSLKMKIKDSFLKASLSRIKQICEQMVRECDKELAEEEINHKNENLAGLKKTDNSERIFPENRVSGLQNSLAQLQLVFERLHADTIVEYEVENGEELVEDQDLRAHVVYNENDIDWGIDVVEKLEYQHDYLEEMEKFS